MPSVATVRHWRRRRRRRPEAAVAHEAPEMPPRAACKPHCLAQRRTIIAHFFQLLRKLGLLPPPPPPSISPLEEFPRRGYPAQPCKHLQRKWRASWPRSPGVLGGPGSCSWSGVGAVGRWASHCRPPKH